MTTRADWLALAARAEAAQGPDRALDAEIAWFLMPGDRKRLGPPDLRRECFHLGLQPPRWVPWDDVALFHAAYTASFDAALAVVPEGWGGSVGVRRGTATLLRIGGQDMLNVAAATPALALLAAACRAQAEEAGDE